MFDRRLSYAVLCALAAVCLSGCGSHALPSSSPTASTAQSQLVISTSPVTPAIDGIAYSLAMNASGGKPGYQWSVHSGALPAGLSLQASTGMITGTPTTSGTSSFEVAATDQSDPTQTATAAVSLAVVPRLILQTSSPAQAQVGATYDFQPQVTGGAPAYSWSLSAGSLPAGITLNTTTGALSGTPTTAGTTTFSLTVNDSATPSQSQTVTYTLPVIPQVQPLTISAGSIPDLIVGESVSTQFAASGGTPGYTWMIASGSLPSGLTLAASTGILSGAASASGSFPITVAVTDKSTPAQTQSIKLTLTSLAKLNLTTASLPSATASMAYSATVSATGGVPAYIWSVSSGSLPKGLTLNAATGALSGTPSAAGTTTFSLTVKDSGTPSQSQTVTYILPVIPQVQPLTISAASIPDLIVGESFSTQLAASGGTPAYTWAITSGSLPSGLALAPSTGILSGAASASGSFPITVAVTDKSTPAQTQSVKLTLTSLPKLNLTTASLPSATAGTLYSATLSATGGAPAYTWSMSSGSLPSGVTLNSASGALNGTPTAAGNFSFVISVADQDALHQVASLPFTITVAAAAPTLSTGTTWYVRPDGGSRYSSNRTDGQCDGKSDQPYPGTGVNQHCAFNDVRYLWQDGSYTVTNSASAFPAYGWIGSGGDTYLIRGSIASGVSWRVGFQNNAQAFDAASAHFWGVQGDPYDSGAPPPPSGTAAQHTRILGENYQSCHTPSARTQLHGGYGVSTVLDMRGVSYVDVACLDITDYSSCGLASQTNTCVSTIGQMSDYAATGVHWSRTSTQDTLTDLRIHGMGSAGMIGPTGDGVTMQYLDLIGNAASGWNADAGDGLTGTGTLNVQHYTISWNGCAEEYPIADAVPYQDCTDDNVGGYGDGFGTATIPSNPGWRVTFDQGLVTYNTQDGLDALHLTGSGSSMTVTRTEAYGNMGQQIKVGGASGIVLNNLIVTNCNALRQSIPGTPAGFNQRLSDFCRAADAGILLTVGANSRLTFDFNTVYSASATGIGIACDTTNGPCNATSLIDYRNNIFLGFLNNSGSGYSAGTGDFSSPIYNGAGVDFFANAGSLYSNNITYHAKSNWSCPAQHEQKAICGDPQTVDETWHPYDAGDMAPLPYSIAIGSGTPITSVLQDFLGGTRGLLPTIGALEQ